MFWITNLNYVVGTLGKIDEMIGTYFFPSVTCLCGNVPLSFAIFVLSSA